MKQKHRVIAILLTEVSFTSIVDGENCLCPSQLDQPEVFEALFIPAYTVA